MVPRLIETILEWFSRHLLDCSETTLDISRSMDQTTGFWKRFNIKLHLLTCQACRNYFKQLKVIQRAVRKLDDDTDSPACDLSIEAKQRLKAAVLLAVL